MKEYILYTLSDFLVDDDFVHWVKNPNKETDLFWEQIRRENNCISNEMDLAIQVIRDISQCIPEVPISEVNTTLDNILKNIQSRNLNE